MIDRRDFFATCVSAMPAAVASSAAVAQSQELQETEPTIDADFPGGNIIVERIQRDHVYLRQDQRDTPGFWFYWYFRVRGAAGRRLTFHFTGGNVLGVRGPAVSGDDGKTWCWAAPDAAGAASFAHAFPEQAEAVRFCLAVPYQEADLHRFLRRHAGNAHLKVEQHSTTAAGRKTERLRFGKLDGEPAHRVLLTCRHHSCEMMASYVLEGVVEAVLADTADGRWFRQNVELAAVPMMDKDGVEAGDQGKNRRPHDHNRDYLGESIYPAVAALKRFVPKWSDGKLKISLDLHCPWIRGGGNEQVFFVGSRIPEMWKRQQHFSRILHEVQTGPLKHDPRHNVPWGKGWNSATEPKSCSSWMALRPEVLVGVTIEVPYANAGGRPVTAESARLLGHDLARAMRRYVCTGD